MLASVLRLPAALAQGALRRLSIEPGRVAMLLACPRGPLRAHFEEIGGDRSLAAAIRASGVAVVGERLGGHDAVNARLLARLARSGALRGLVHLDVSLGEGPLVSALRPNEQKIERAVPGAVAHGGHDGSAVGAPAHAERRACSAARIPCASESLSS